MIKGQIPYPLMGIYMNPGPNVLIKRKFRYTVEFFKDEQVIIPQSFVKVGGRPNPINETEINWLVKSNWGPRWESIGFTFYGVDKTKNLFRDVFLSPIDDFTVKLTLYDGCGWELEHWLLTKSLIESMSLIDRDYADDGYDVEMRVRYFGYDYKPNPTLRADWNWNNGYGYNSVIY